MTEKRAEDGGRRSKDPETDLGMERIKKKAVRTKGVSALAMVSDAARERPVSGVEQPQPPATASMLDGAGGETDAAIHKIFHGQKVDYEMAEVHDKFIYEEFKGEKALHEPRTAVLSQHLPESEKGDVTGPVAASEAPPAGEGHPISAAMAEQLRMEGLSD